MMNFTKNKKVLFGLAVSLVLAMAVGSFAISEIQTPASPQMTETKSKADEPIEAGDFYISGDNIQEGIDYTFETYHEQLIIISDKEMTIQNKDPETPINDTIVVNLPDSSLEANIILNGVNIDPTDNAAALLIWKNAEFNVNITLAEGSKNFLTGEGSRAGLEKGDDGTVKPGRLTITGKGKLTENAGFCGAGIGSSPQQLCPNTTGITIKGTNIEAHGGFAAAGIGGGSVGNASDIEIIDSTVIATGGDAIIGSDSSAGAGIGGGDIRNGSKITISNSIVTATGGSGGSADGFIQTSAAAIGGGGGSLKSDGTWEFNPGTGSENKIDDSSILIAKGGEDGDSYSIETLQGFDEDS